MEPINTATVHIVVMAKAPVAGEVKTRLIGGRISPRQTADIHSAMLRCVVSRLSDLPRAWVGRQIQHVLSLAGADDVAHLGFELPASWQVTDQGEGDLGQRLASVWQRVGSGACVFFGSDSPDVPKAHLNAIRESLGQSDAVVGPVDDGGYWTIGANRLFPPLLEGIDWGTASVYHQTRQAAAASGIALHDLPPWYDVDEMPDLAALRERLNGSEEQALKRLAHDLDNILEGSPS